VYSSSVLVAVGRLDVFLRLDLLTKQTMSRVPDTPASTPRISEPIPVVAYLHLLSSIVNTAGSRMMFTSVAGEEDQACGSVDACTNMWVHTLVIYTHTYLVVHTVGIFFGAHHQQYCELLKPARNQYQELQWQSGC
jgi:hypothetical protein